jgi:hypothetical protein
MEKAFTTEDTENTEFGKEKIKKKIAQRPGGARRYAEKRKRRVPPSNVREENPWHSIVRAHPWQKPPRMGHPKVQG